MLPLSFIPTFSHQQILLALPSKYTQNLTLLGTSLLSSPSRQTPMRPYWVRPPAAPRLLVSTAVRVVLSKCVSAHVTLLPKSSLGEKPMSTHWPSRPYEAWPRGSLDSPIPSLLTLFWLFQSPCFSSSLLGTLLPQGLCNCHSLCKQCFPLSLPLPLYEAFSPRPSLALLPPPQHGHSLRLLCHIHHRHTSLWQVCLLTTTLSSIRGDLFSRGSVCSLLVPAYSRNMRAMNE